MSSPAPWFRGPTVSTSSLTTGFKGVPQYQPHRLAIGALREERLVGRIRSSYVMQTDRMIANDLTKDDPSCITSLDVLTQGRWAIVGNLRIRKIIKCAGHEEHGVLNVRQEG